MGSLRVVLAVELVDEDLGLEDGVELLDVQQVPPHRAVEPFDERVLLGARPRVRCPSGSRVLPRRSR